MSKAKKPKPGESLEELLRQASMEFSLVIMAIAKLQFENTGERSGQFLCPRCREGTVVWSVAPGNNHARVCCSRLLTDEDGDEVHCTQAME